jgi:hypothetical protein
MIDKSYFKKTFNSLLTEFSYINKGQSWYLNGLDSNVVINLQKSDFDDKYYINFGIWINGIGINLNPKENNCHIQGRLDSIFPDEIEIIERGCYLNVEDERYFLKFMDLFRTRVIVFLTECQNAEFLKSKFQEGAFKKALVMKSARDFFLN